MKDLNLIHGVDISDVKEDLICYSYDASYARERFRVGCVA